MRGGVISVCLKTPAQPRYCFGVDVERDLGNTDPHEPLGSMWITGREAKRLSNVSFGFRTAAKKVLGIPDKTMGDCGIAVQRQRMFELRDALCCAFRAHQGGAQCQVRRSVVRRKGQRFGGDYLGCSKPR
jgi:hypothetical protein